MISKQQAKHCRGAFKPGKCHAVRRTAVFFAALGFLLVAPPQAYAGGPSIAAQPLSASDFTDQIIVKLRDRAVGRVTALSAAHVDSLTTAAGVQLTHHRHTSGDAQVMKLPGKMTLAQVEAITRRLSADPNIEYAEPDRRMYPMMAPNDTQYANQWHLRPATSEAGSANLEAAWDITQGSSSITVAVIDTGLLPHADIDTNILDGTGRVVAGYDFISDSFVGNDGGTRDSNPTDPGDWETANQCFPGSSASNSSWHGTHVAGTIGANGNNNLGVTGINWNSKILPVRVLGKCGGYESDIVDGARWAAGLSVTGVTTNPNPAKVLNLSLGGSGACSTSEQNAINEITAAGAVVVVAAGNNNANVSDFSPANCNGVITVAAVNRSGSRAGYSNFGSLVEIAAPGGDTTTGSVTANGVLSTLNAGTTTATADSYEYHQGTSMATPHVAGVASLMLSLRPNMKPARTLAFLQQTARAFPPGSTCITSSCGAGMLDAAAAVQAVNNTVAPSANAGVDKSANPGASVALNGSGTPTAPALIASYSWIQTAGQTVTIINSGTANASFTAPNGAVGTVLTFQLTATDDVGMTGTDTINVALLNVAPVLAPIGNKTVTIGDTLNFTVSATDANGTTPTLSASNLPVGATFTPATGVFNWTSATPLGTYSNIIFSASDSVNAPTSETISITVQNPVAAPPSSGGGGCSLSPNAGFDPTLLLLVLASIVMLRRRARI